VRGERGLAAARLRFEPPRTRQALLADFNRRHETAVASRLSISTMPAPLERFSRVWRTRDTANPMRERGPRGECSSRSLRAWLGEAAHHDETRFRPPLGGKRVPAIRIQAAENACNRPVLLI